MQLRKTLFAIALFLSPALAFAHGGHDHSGLLSGVAYGATHWGLRRMFPDPVDTSVSSLSGSTDGSVAPPRVLP